MIFGIGTDICDIRAWLMRWRGVVTVLRRRCWAPGAACLSGAPHACRAGTGLSGHAFAAKEAFSKAIGWGLRAPMSWHACELLNGPIGKPSLCCTASWRSGLPTATCARR